MGEITVDMDEITGDMSEINKYTASGEIFADILVASGKLLLT